MKSRFVLLSLPISLFPSAARACAVCFGAMPPDMSRGFYWGILLLLLLPPAMILAFAGVIIHHVRKNRRSLQELAR